MDSKEDFCSGVFCGMVITAIICTAISCHDTDKLNKIIESDSAIRDSIENMVYQQQDYISEIDKSNSNFLKYTQDYKYVSINDDECESLLKNDIGGNVIPEDVYDCICKYALEKSAKNKSDLFSSIDDYNWSDSEDPFVYFPNLISEPSHPDSELYVDPQDNIDKINSNCESMLKSLNAIAPNNN